MVYMFEGFIKVHAFFYDFLKIYSKLSSRLENTIEFPFKL